MNTNDYIALEEQYGAHNYHPLDVVIEHAAGAWVTDVEGRRYLDCLAAYSAVIPGVAATASQFAGLALLPGAAAAIPMILPPCFLSRIGPPLMVSTAFACAACGLR